MAFRARNDFGTFEKRAPGHRFSKVPKLFGSISGATIPFISSQRRGSKPSNFAILLDFLILKTCKKISFSKQADCSLTTSFSGPKSSRDFRETGPRSPISKPFRFLDTVKNPVSSNNTVKSFVQSTLSSFATAPVSICKFQVCPSPTTRMHEMG